jgi:glycosyltransferase involved in cell wall biosynthesis
MKIAIYVTNFKNDLMEAISLNATRLAFLVGKQADCTLLVPGEISNDAGEMPGLNWESYDRSYTYASKGRVVKNIIGLGRHLRRRLDEFDIVHIHVGNLLELFLIRIFVPRPRGVTIVTVWQPYLGFLESLQFPAKFGRKFLKVVHHILFNSWALVPLYFFGHSFFDRIVVPTKYQKSQLSFFPTEKICVIPNGVPSPREESHRPVNDPPLVLYIGHATAVKGIDTMLRAFAMALGEKNFRVTLGTSNFGDQKIQDEVDRHGLNHITNLKGCVDVYSEMIRHDIFILPHKTAVGTTCYPNVALEAFACGIPLIATRTPVLEELIADEEAGMLVSLDGGPQELKEALLILLANAERRDSIRRVQKAVFLKHYTIEGCTEAYLRLYRELAK